MAYLGRQPIIGNYQVLDTLTASATATYALTKNSVAVFPQTPANCIVSLNGVIQAPFDSYTISGSNIVFASALTGSDSIDFITVLGDVLNVGTVSDSTITTAKLADSSVTTAKLNDASVSLAKLTATGTKDATTFLRGDNTFASAGGANTPAFLATPSGVTAVNVTETIVNNYSVEVLDTDNCYDTSTSKFTPTTAGYYFITALIGSFPNYTATQFVVGLKKNGTTFAYTNHYVQSYPNTQVSGITYLNGSTDYVQVYVYHNQGANQTLDGGASRLFAGFKIIT
jgi:hypothetical protein